MMSPGYHVAPVKIGSHRDPSSRLLLLVLFAVSGVNAWNNWLPKQFTWPVQDGNNLIRSTATTSTLMNRTRRPYAMKPEIQKIEDALIQTIQDQKQRLANSDRIDALIQDLEGQSLRGGSIPEPAIATEIYGRWRLLYTTNTNTASPIQRGAVNAQVFPIYQDILLTNEDTGPLIVRQVVQFSNKAKLQVDALASTTAYPLPEFMERQSDGTVFGMNLLGVSLVNNEAKPDPNRPNSRIDFVFDYGMFDFGNNIQIPYPVPFRLPFLRDWVKGWIDITWLSDRLRISRGNKGTTFVLLKEQESK